MFVFGSYAKGEVTQYSDIDIALIKLIRHRQTSCYSFLFLWCVRLPLYKVTKVRNRGICWFAAYFINQKGFLYLDIIKTNFL